MAGRMQITAAFVLQAALVLASCSAPSAESLGSHAGSGPADLLDEIEAAPPAREGVRRIGEVLEVMAPSLSASEGEAALQRASRYLDRARAGASKDPGLAADLVTAYQRLGALYEPLDAGRALEFYLIAAHIVVEAAQGKPTEGAYRVQYQQLAQRIEALGGVVPGGSDSQREGRPSAVAADPAPPDKASVQQPQAARDSAPSQRELITTQQRLITVKAKCLSAEDAYRGIQRSAQRLGFSPHPDITTAYHRMQLAIESAEQELKDGKGPAARESLDLADASANQVLQAAGSR